MTDHLVSYLRSALTDSGTGRVTFQHLSDEETVVIETDDPSRLTVQPWIESQKHLDAASASLFGRRSLYLRGLLTIEIDAHTGEESLKVSDELRFAADARRLGVAYVFAVATQRGERTARNNVLHSQVGTFEEDIDTNGFHHLSACTYRAALHGLAEWTYPNGGHHGGELQTQVPQRRWHRWAAKDLGPDVRTVEINLLLPDGNGSFAGETLHAAHSRDAAVLAIPDGDKLRVTSASANRLEYQLGERVGPLLGVEI